MLRRFFAFLVAFSFVCALSAPALASDEDPSSYSRNFWDYTMARLASSDWAIGGLLTDAVAVALSDNACAYSADGYHHGNPSDIAGKTVKQGKKGQSYVTLNCTKCGLPFDYYSANLEDSYTQNYSGCYNCTGEYLEGVFHLNPNYYYISGGESSNVSFSPSDSSLSCNLYFDNSSTSTYFSFFSLPASCSSLSSRIDILPFDWFIKKDDLFLLAPTINCYVGASNDYLTSFSSFSVPNSESFKPDSVFDSSSYIYSFSGRSFTFSNPFNYFYFTARIRVSRRCSYSFNFPVRYRVYPSSFSLPFYENKQIEINNTTYNINSFDFDNRTILTDNGTEINFGDTNYTIKQGDTFITNNYFDNNYDSGGESGGESGGGGDSSDIDLDTIRKQLNYTNEILNEISNKFDNIECDHSQTDYLLFEIQAKLTDIEYALTHPDQMPDYSEKLTLICNQLANIWGDVEGLNNSVSSIDVKIDTVNDDLQAILDELQEQKGFLQEIRDLLKAIKKSVLNIEDEVDALNSKEKTDSWFASFLLKFSFLSEVGDTMNQLFADIDSDARSANLVAMGEADVDDLVATHDFSGGSGDVLTRPEVLVELHGSALGIDFDDTRVIDFAWYARFKPGVDQLLSGFITLAYIVSYWRVLPGLVRGSALTESTIGKIIEERRKPDD